MSWSKEQEERDDRERRDERERARNDKWNEKYWSEIEDGLCPPEPPGVDMFHVERLKKKWDRRSQR